MGSRSRNRNAEKWNSTYWQPLSIEKYTDALRGSGNVVGPPGHQSHSVFIQDAHFKLGQIRPEGDASELLSIKRFDASVPCLAHVVVPSLRKTKCLIPFSLHHLYDYMRANMNQTPSCLLEGLPWLFTGSLYSELCAKDVAKLCTIAIASTWGTSVSVMLWLEYWWVKTELNWIYCKYRLFIFGWLYTLQSSLFDCSKSNAHRWLSSHHHRSYWKWGAVQRWEQARRPSPPCAPPPEYPSHYSIHW